MRGPRQLTKTTLAHEADDLLGSPGEAVTGAARHLVGEILHCHAGDDREDEEGADVRQLDGYAAGQGPVSGWGGWEWDG